MPPLKTLSRHFPNPTHTNPIPLTPNGVQVKVSKVEEAVKESWFQEALSLQKSLYSLQKVALLP